MPNGSFLITSMREGRLRNPGVGGGGIGEAVGCHPVTLLPELAVQLCVLQVYTRDGIIDNG